MMNMFSCRRISAPTSYLSAAKHRITNADMHAQASFPVHITIRGRHGHRPDWNRALMQKKEPPEPNQVERVFSSANALPDDSVMVAPSPNIMLSAQGEANLPTKA